MTDLAALSNIISKKLGELDRDQAWLAAETGLSPATISRYINCESRPSYDNARKIAKAFGLSREASGRLLAAAGYDHDPTKSIPTSDIDYDHYPSEMREQVKKLLDLQSRVNPQDPELVNQATCLFKEFDAILDECRELQSRLQHLQLSFGQFYGSVELLRMYEYQGLGPDKIASLRTRWQDVFGWLTAMYIWSDTDRRYIGKSAPIVKGQVECVKQDWAGKLKARGRDIDQELCHLAIEASGPSARFVISSQGVPGPLFESTQKLKDELDALLGHVNGELKSIAAESNRWTQRLGGIENQR